MAKGKRAVNKTEENKEVAQQVPQQVVQQVVQQQEVVSVAPPSVPVNVVVQESKPVEIVNDVKNENENTLQTEESSVAPSEKNILQQRQEVLSSKVKQCLSILRDVSTELALLNKDISRHVKLSSKKSKKNRSDEPRNVKSGITQEVLISDELCNFMGLPHGSKVSRTDVTRKITKYIEEKKLQNPQNGRFIDLDDVLKSLLKPPEGVPVNYFGLQKFLKSHYQSNKKPTTSESIAVSV
jgi:chromatin remodeling complex protein RSC6